MGVNGKLWTTLVAANKIYEHNIVHRAESTSILAFAKWRNEQIIFVGRGCVSAGQWTRGSVTFRNTSLNVSLCKHAKNFTWVENIYVRTHEVQKQAETELSKSAYIFGINRNVIKNLQFLFRTTTVSVISLIVGEWACTRAYIRHSQPKVQLWTCPGVIRERFSAVIFFGLNIQPERHAKEDAFCIVGTVGTSVLLNHWPEWFFSQDLNMISP